MLNKHYHICVQNSLTLHICVGVEPPPGDLAFRGQRLEVAARLVVDDAHEIVRAGGAQDVEDVIELVQVVLAREYGSVGQHLSEDATWGGGS